MVFFCVVNSKKKENPLTPGLYINKVIPYLQYTGCFFNNWTVLGSSINAVELLSP